MKLLVSYMDHFMSIITVEQIRAAKAMLRWSGEHLAQRSGVSLSSIRRLESSSGTPDRISVGNLKKIVVALEHGGIEFVGSPDDKPGVRLVINFNIQSE
jgi:transcriptional regulator with XRE-family HTH domain